MTRLVLALTLIFALPACEKSTDKTAAGKDAPPSAPVPASCQWDEDCANPKYICMYEKCVKGERSEEAKKAIEAQRKADAEKARLKAEADRPPGPGEGRLMVRICPFVRKTGQFTSKVTAKSKATGQETTLLLEELLRPDQVQSEFLFRKLPVGEYEVTADYGVKVGQQRDVVQLKCDKKAKQPCAKDKLTRLMTVVPVDQEPAPKIGENGKPEKKPCDWVAE